MTSLLRFWRCWWFHESSLVNLAAARIVLAVLVLRLDCTGRFDTIPLVSRWQWSPVPAVTFFGGTPPDEATVAWMTTALEGALVSAALGLGTNFALAIAFTFQCILEAWLNCLGKVTHATLPMLYALLAFSLSNCGRRLSIDAWIRERLDARDGSVRPSPPATSTMAAWPLEFVFLVIASFYAQAGFAKLSQGGLAWADGYTLQFYLLQDGTEAGAWLAGQLALCRILSVLVLVFELGFPVAIFARRLRPVAFAGGLFFHAGTTVFLDVGFWPLWSLYSLFLPWERILGAAIRRPRSHALRHLPVPS